MSRAQTSTNYRYRVSRRKISYAPPHDGRDPSGTSKFGNDLEGFVGNACRNQELRRIGRAHPVILVYLTYAPCTVQVELQSLDLRETISTRDARDMQISARARAVVVLPKDKTTRRMLYYYLRIKCGNIRTIIFSKPRIVFPLFYGPRIIGERKYILYILPRIGHFV